MSDRPYLLDGHMYQYDLGWMIEQLSQFKQDLQLAIDKQTITYADPIQWDITTQYPSNTVVVDPKMGTAYLSKQAVPQGILLTDTDYWQPIFNYQAELEPVMRGTATVETGTTASRLYQVNDLVWYKGALYRVTRTIAAGDAFTPDYNLTTTSVESLLAAYYGRDRTTQVTNDTLKVSGDYTINAGDIAETSTNKVVKVTGDREVDVDGATTEIYTGTHTETNADTRIINAKDLQLNPTNPLTYRTPSSGKYKSVPFKDAANNHYDVLVASPINTNLIVSTYADILDFAGEAGDVVYCLGYYTPGDLGACYYKIGDTGEVTLANGLKATRICREVTPEMFGVIGNDPNIDESAKWDACLAFAKTNKCPVHLYGKLYFIRKPLIISTDLIGNNNTALYCFTQSGFGLVDATNKSKNGYDLKYTAAVCVDPYSGSRTTNLTIRGLDISGATADDQDFVKIGIFVPDSSNITIEQCTISRTSLWAVETRYAWLVTIRDVIIYNATNGICAGGSSLTESAAATSTLIERCYLHDTNNTGLYGYLLHHAYYSAIRTCAYDNGKTRRGYGLVDCQAAIIDDCGIEGFTGTDVFYFESTKNCELGKCLIASSTYTHVLNTSDVRADSYAFPSLVSSTGKAMRIYTFGNVHIYGDDLETTDITLEASGNIILHHGANISRKVGTANWTSVAFT